jgi:hypothetical protein
LGATPVKGLAAVEQGAEADEAPRWRRGAVLRSLAPVFDVR